MKYSSRSKVSPTVRLVKSSGRWKVLSVLLGFCCEVSGAFEAEELWVGSRWGKFDRAIDSFVKLASILLSSLVVFVNFAEGTALFTLEALEASGTVVPNNLA